MTTASELWEKVLPDLEWDGSWRDIYVLDVSEVEWNRVIAWLNAADFGLTISLRDGASRHIPSFEMIADGDAEWVATASFSIQGVMFKCHFFDPDQIEFDIDPRELTPLNWPGVLEFMTELSRVCGKPSRMTPENCPGNAFLIVDCVSGAEFILMDSAS